MARHVVSVGVECGGFGHFFVLVGGWAVVVVVGVRGEDLVLPLFDGFDNVYCSLQYEEHLIAFISVLYDSLALWDKQVG